MTAGCWNAASIRSPISIGRRSRSTRATSPISCASAPNARRSRRRPNVRIAAERAHIQSFVDRFRAKATKARQAQSRLKALERLPPIEAVVEDHPVRFAFPAPEELAPPILSLTGCSVGYGGPPILQGA